VPGYVRKARIFTKIDVLENADRNNFGPSVKNEQGKQNNSPIQQGIEKINKRSDKSPLQKEDTPKIMIVDDEEDILLSFKTFLKENKSLMNVNAETFKPIFYLKWTLGELLFNRQKVEMH